MLSIWKASHGLAMVKAVMKISGRARLYRRNLVFRMFSRYRISVDEWKWGGRSGGALRKNPSLKTNKPFY
jgi:hypothetical protein